MSKKGNILLVANWESNVGYAWWLMENFWITIAGHFESKNINSHLIYPQITQLPESISTSNIEIHECDFQNHSLKNLRKLHDLIKTNDIRFIYLSDSPTYSLFYTILRVWGIKKIVVHDHTPGERSKATSWRKLIKSLIQNTPYFTADHFIAVTDFVHQRHLEVNCIPARKCSVARNGIIPIDLKHADKLYAYREFNIPTDSDIVITTGRASYYKGIDFFIGCADELINRQGNKLLHFLFCGDGPDTEDFKKLVRQKGIEDFFTFAGRRSDIHAILPSCSIGFHAAIGEVGYSLSILEYMSAGLVAIVPDSPSTSLATTDMENGIVYRGRDIESATEALKFALDSRNHNEITRNAIRSIEKNFNLKMTNMQLTDILDRVFTAHLIIL
jgi:glycosyltransferase involved in cell wall biosynthesis